MNQKTKQNVGKVRLTYGKLAICQVTNICIAGHYRSIFNVYKQTLRRTVQENKSRSDGLWSRWYLRNGLQSVEC